MMPDAVKTRLPVAMKTHFPGGRNIGVSLAWVGWLLLMNSGGCIADTGTLNFSGTLEAGTCSLNVSPSRVEWNGVDPSGIVDGGDWATAGDKTPFDVVLTGCSGVGKLVQRPSVQMTGLLLTGTGITGNSYLFKSSGDSQGFGVVVFSGSPAGPKVGKDEWLTIDGYGLGTSLHPTGATIKLYTAISAGPKSWQGVNHANLRAGRLDATLTFTFAYH